MIVDFKGVNYSCPEGTKFLAMDKNGYVYAYKKEPYPLDKCWDSAGDQIIVCPYLPDYWKDEIYTVS